MQQWEYHLIGFSRGKVTSTGGLKLTYAVEDVKSLPRNLPVVSEYLEKAGLDGWEAVGVSDHWILLKRPLSAPAAG